MKSGVRRSFLQLLSNDTADLRTSVNFNSSPSPTSPADFHEISAECRPMSPLAVVEIWSLHSHGFGPKSKRENRGSNDTFVADDYSGTSLHDVVDGGRRVGGEDAMLTTMLRE